MVRVILVLLLTYTAADSYAQQTWPQWRGPQRDGVSPGEAWPANLDDDSLTQQWRVELGPSYSGPIVSESLVFTTETKDKEQEVVTAFDRQTGEKKWTAEWQGAMRVPFFAASNGSWIRSTPACDGQHLYVAGMRDVLVCLEANTGKEVWRLDFMQQFNTPLPAFGFVCSPLVDGDDLYVQAGGGLVKLDKNTGAVQWRVLDDGGGMGGSAFSSPVIATLNGTRQLVVQTRTTLAGVNLTSGSVLWSQQVPAFRGMNILTPIPVGDAVFTSSYQNKSWLYQIDSSDQEMSVSTKWENNAKAYMSSPVKIDGYLYMHLQNNRFACLDLATGERLWTSTPYGKYASLVVRDGKILALVSDGTLLLIEANPQEFKLLGKTKVAEGETWAHLAVAGNELFVRELNALAAYKWE